MGKVVINNSTFLHHYTVLYVVIQTVLGGLTIYPPVANFLQCVCAKNMTVVGSRQSYCNNNQAYVFGPPCIVILYTNRHTNRGKGIA